MIHAEDSHSGRVRASRTRVDESLEGSNPSSSALGSNLKFLQVLISAEPLPDTESLLVRTSSASLLPLA